MALDPVPWFVGGAAEHSAEAARNIAWNATQGRTGVATPESLKVSALPTAGGGVRVSPGGAAIESTFAGATQQSYTVRNDATATVDIPANNTANERHQRVAAYVKDPQYAGSMPSDPANGPYTDWYVGTSWPNWPHVKLAFIRIPPHTSVITNSMIRDERTLLNPRRESVLHARPRLASDNYPAFSRRTTAGGEIFPGGRSSGDGDTTIFVPEWATRMIIQAHWLSVRYAASTNPNGQMWVEYGDEYREFTWPGNRQYQYGTQLFNFDSPGASNNTMRTNWMVHDAVPVPAKLRGKDVTFAFKAGFNANATTGTVLMDRLSGLSMEVTFAEKAIDADTL